MSEIVGLRVEDVDVTGNIPHLIIRPNKVRSLKTKNSERKVPLIADSLESAREALRGAKDGWVFPSYYYRFNNASSALSKALRKAGVTDKKITTHSLRHSFVQALRDAAVPEVVAQALAGHAGSNAVHGAYGSGMALGVLRDGVEQAIKQMELE